MIDASITQFSDFRHRLFGLFKFRADATMDLIDAVASKNQESVVKTSLNPLFRRKYSSITDVVDNLFRCTAEQNPNEEELRTEHLRLSQLLAAQCPIPKKRGFTLLAVDCTAKSRIYSSKVADRSVVHAPNHVPGQKPITVGHEYSLVVYLPEDEKDRNAHWTFPLSIRRVKSHETGPQVGFEQVQMLTTQTALQQELCVTVADAAYSTKHWLANGAAIPNLVHIARLRSNRVLYRQATSSTEGRARGRPVTYGEQFHLKSSPEPDEKIQFTITRPSGKAWVIHLSRWNNLLTQGGKHPFDVVRAQVFDETGKLIFKKPLWMMVTGQRRGELGLRHVYESYTQRYDIEHCFRFGKQKLLLAKSQTPDTRHEENLAWITVLCFAMLYSARQSAVEVRYSWEKHKVIDESRTASIAQVQRDYERIIRGIGTPACIPKPRGKSPGRCPGTVVPRRPVCPLIRKARPMAARC
ncbi:MAG: transposase [Rhabdochlamydiaceae bacterium]